MAPNDARKKLERIRRKKGKNVKDLRQIISKKTKTKNDRGSRGDTNKRINPTREGNRRTDRLTQRASYNDKNHNPVVRRTSFKNNKPTQQYYIPPHQQPTYIIAPPARPAMDNVAEAQGASILVSNLMPSITQSEIIELFGDIGVMTAVNMINSTTALVTYQNSSDAVRAVKVYHNRLLDSKPMLVNMMPNTSTNVRSRIGQSSSIY